MRVSSRIGWVIGGRRFEQTVPEGARAWLRYFVDGDPVQRPDYVDEMVKARQGEQARTVG